MVVCVLAGGGRDTSQIAVLESIAIAFKRKDLGMMHESVNHCGGDHVVSKDFSPASEDFV
jgi:hypothetical protein